MTLVPEKERIQDLAAKRRPSGTPNPNRRKQVTTCVTKLYKTDSDVSDSDFATHETDEFKEEDECEDGVWTALPNHLSRTILYF